VSNIKQAFVPEVDGFDMQQITGNHLQGDQIPCFPQSFPFFQSGQIEIAFCGIVRLFKQGHIEGWAFQEPKRVAALLFRPSVDGSKVGFRE
jgi:hypothetical protein